MTQKGVGPTFAQKSRIGRGQVIVGGGYAGSKSQRPSASRPRGPRLPFFVVRVIDLSDLFGFAVGGDSFCGAEHCVRRSVVRSFENAPVDP